MSATPKSFSRILKGITVINLVFETKTGLLIRMPVHAQTYRIGGAEQYPMITRKRYRLSSGEERELEIPYIPGSSLKGRIRSLLELSLNLKLYSADPDQKIWQHVRSLATMDPNEFYQDVVGKCIVDDLFGYAATNYKQLIDKLGEDRATQVFSQLAATRLLVDDFFPTKSYVERVDAKSIADFVEEKSENRIDRITSAADPRDIVRVRPGVEFEGRLVLMMFDSDRDSVQRFLNAIVTGLRLLEEMYLGGSGSRGYGRIVFTNISVTALKISICNDGVPKLVETGIKDRKYTNVKEFERAVEELSKEIVQSLYA